MKNILILIAVTFAFIMQAQATPVTTNVITISSPKIGQAPAVNHVVGSTTPFYRISWRTITVSGSDVNYLTSFAYNGAQFYSVDNIYAATTYAEIQTKATALGITNLPADPQAEH